MSLLYLLSDFADFQRFFYDQVIIKIDFFEEPDIIIVEWDFMSDFFVFFAYSLFRIGNKNWNWRVTNDCKRACVDFICRDFPTH